MKNTVILSVGAGGTFDAASVQIGNPPYIVAENKIVTFYTGIDGSTVSTIGAAMCPSRSDYDLLDTGSKLVGTYEKPVKLWLKKLGKVLALGTGAPDDVAVFMPSYVYNKKLKKFMVYYFGDTGPGTYTICMASGPEPDALVKASSSIISAPAGGAFSTNYLSVLFDKEENLYKLYYIVLIGGVYNTYVATSKNGYDW